MTPAKTKCPVHHEIGRNFDVVPLDCCGICGGTGYVEPKELLDSVVRTEVVGFTLDLVKTERFGPIWMCPCSIFYKSTSMPPFCIHTSIACKRVQALRKKP